MPAAVDRVRRAAAVIVVSATAATVLTACDDDGPGDSEAFCEAVAENLDGLRAIPTTGDEIDALIDLWRDVGESAPLAIEPDWDAYGATLETAWTGPDEEEILATAFASEQPAANVATWLRENCAIDWGPVTTIVPQALPTSSVPGSVPPTG